MNNVGKLITVEGCDGSGKTTVIKYIAEQLTLNGYKVVVTREPGGTKIAEQLRDILLNSDPAVEEISPLTELFMMMAARKQHIETKIKPLIAEGYIVLTDRFVDSGYAYQACGRDMLEDFLVIEKMTLDNFSEDLVLFFDVSFETSRTRVLGRLGQQDRLDMEEDLFHKKVYDGYQVRMEQKKERVVRFDAELTPDLVKQNVINFVNQYFPNKDLNK